MKIVALGAVLVAGVCTSGASASSAGAPPIIFSADRAPALSGEIYRLDLNGHRVDLSRSPFTDSHPVVSPDGKRVAFFSDRGSAPGSFRVYAVRIDGRGLIAVSGPLSSQYDPELTWAPDSTRLAAAVALPGSGSHMGLYLLHPGRPERLVARAPAIGDPTWSPDGRVIAFGGIGRAVRLLTAGGQTIRVVSHNGYPFAWSADGTLAISGAGLVSLYDEAGKQIRAFPGRSFQWSPDGLRLAVVTRRRLEVRTSAGRLLESRTVAGLRRNDSRLVWADSHRLVVGGTGVDLTTGRTWSASYRYFGVRSPNGRLVAESTGAGSRFTIRVSRLDGTGARTLLVVRRCYDHGLTTGAIDVQFTPDGRSLVYQSYCPESFDDFYAIRPDGTGLRRLTHTPVLKGNPAW